MTWKDDIKWKIENISANIDLHACNNTDCQRDIFSYGTAFFLTAPSAVYIVLKSDD